MKARRVAAAASPSSPSSSVGATADLVRRASSSRRCGATYCRRTATIVRRSGSDRGCGGVGRYGTGADHCALAARPRAARSAVLEGRIRTRNAETEKLRSKTWITS
ncbi:hypothetical protein FQA47_006485 [Oryzias melastigma]|uniref:Uncharacterized protein n=1 Tax=Oryzias melastigma TaxID=30732 RepID=A0A834L059_ORYME|nr:hypothetical protein FQA47_006485 [Oryzias melastigma]